MNCNNVKDTNELQRIFKAIKETHRFGVIEIHGSPLNKLPAQVFSPQIFGQFLLSNNYIETVENEAFKGSEEFVNRIHLDGNRLTRFSFEALTGLKSLNALELQNNYLQSIPDDALENLSLVNLEFNKINEIIGKNAFSRLPGLTNLVLINNQLRYLQERSLAFDKQTGKFSIHLQYNSIVEIHDEAFAGAKIKFLNLANNSLLALNENALRPLLEDGTEINVEDNNYNNS